MIKYFTFILSSFFLINSLKAQESDEEIHRLLIGDWYSFVIDSLDYSDEDSVYIEYSFTEHDFDYQMSIPPNRNAIVPYTICNGYLVLSWDTTPCLEGYRNARVRVIDSNNVILYFQEDTTRLRRLITKDEYTLSDFMHDRLLLYDVTRKMRTPISSTIYFETHTYFQACIIRRDFLQQLARGETNKEIIIKDLTELYINNCDMPELVRIESQEFIQMIDELYPDNQP